MAHQHSHRPLKILVTGASGTGKTSWFLRYVANTKARAKFIFDHEGDLALRLRRRPATNPLELLDQLPTGFVLFDHSRMFPGDRLAGFAFFCDWCMAISSKMPGRKLFAVDELQKLVPHSAVPWEFSNLLDTGRRCGLDLCACCYRPAALHPSVRGQITYCVSFRQNDAVNAKPLAELGFSGEALLALPRFEFIARDLTTGSEQNGQSPR